MKLQIEYMKQHIALQGFRSYALTHWGRDKMAAKFLTTILNVLNVNI